MRLVVKNKEEGTELFKGGNFRPAAARYHKSLSHAAKFFDLGPEDEKEVKNIKTLLYLNLASCYIKLENWDQVVRNCDFALELDPVNPKVYPHPIPLIYLTLISPLPSDVFDVDIL